MNIKLLSVLLMKYKPVLNLFCIFLLRETSRMDLLVFSSILCLNRAETSSFAVAVFMSLLYIDINSIMANNFIITEQCRANTYTLQGIHQLKWISL